MVGVLDLVLPIWSVPKEKPCVCIPDSPAVPITVRHSIQVNHRGNEGETEDARKGQPEESTLPRIGQQPSHSSAIKKGESTDQKNRFDGEHWPTKNEQEQRTQSEACP